MLCDDLDRVADDRCAWTQGAPSEPRQRLHEAVRDAVQTALTDKQRRVVEGYFFEGLSQGDLARSLGVTQQVVQKTLFGAWRDGRRIGGALSRLRSVLAPHLALTEAKSAAST